MIIIEDGLIKYDPKTCTYLVYRERGWYPLLPLVLRLYLRDRYGITGEEALDAAMEEIRTKMMSHDGRQPGIGSGIWLAILL